MKSVFLDSASQAAGAHIVLVTRGDLSSLTLTEANDIRNYAQNNKIKVSTVLVPKGNNQRPLSFYDEVKFDFFPQKILVLDKMSCLANAIS